MNEEKQEWVMRVTWQSDRSESKPNVTEHVYVSKAIAEHAAKDRLTRVNGDGHDYDREGRLLRLEVFMRITTEKFSSVIWDRGMERL